MDLIESIKKDKGYLKSKSIVKNWEKDFKLKHSRTPSKFDIKEAPANIKYAYKKYFLLKSSALESSLSICDYEEPNLSPEILLPLESAPDVENTPELLMPALPSGQELDRLLSSPKINIHNKPITDNLSKKLFHNSKFSIRNPRKSSIYKSQENESQGEHSQTDKQQQNYPELRDAENPNKTLENVNSVINHDIAFQKVNSDMLKEHITLPESLLATSSNMTNSLAKNSIRQINTGWLERATGFTNESINQNCSTDHVLKFGLGNITIPNYSDKPNDIVENSESDDDIAISKLKPALKKQKLNSPPQVSKVEKRHEDQVSSESHVDVTVKVKTKRKHKMPVKLISKDVKLSANKKNDDYNEQPPDIAEYLPFGLNEKINPRHANVSDILKAVESSMKNGYSKQSSSLGEIDKMEKKIQNGTLNENFVKINIEKKVFVRGRKGINYSKYKKQLWKDKKALHGGMEFPEGGKITCFKCGAGGHMARYCTAHRENTLIPLEQCDNTDMPTLEDMQKIISENSKESEQSIEKQLSSFVYEASKVPKEFMQLLASTPENSSEIKSIYNISDNNTKELYNILKKFGHNLFRPGQEPAIKRILSGLSTFLILSTGGGKSLCYQLPAYIYSLHYKCITLVISPLVSLMEDQVLSMPEFLKAGCLHTNQPPTQRRKIMECLKNCELNILLISPEALIAGDTSSGFAGLFKSLPPIAFACIDEAHCVSQWSHNFRPSYLMICRVLREKLNVKCILGLTATASQATINSVIDHINIPDGLNGVVTSPALPVNLYLSVSCENDKDRALVSLLASERISSFDSIIVYCIRRNECERVAAIIRSCLSQPGKINMEQQSKKRKRMSYIAEAYHAGMSAAQRKKIQKHFMDGTLKIIVATVAFGMGINKSDIRCIIHYNMPPSFESYVQEVGRAGRDGQSAFCHVFMNNSTCDKDELLKHIYANSIERPVIRKLLEKVFIPCKCTSSNSSVNTLNNQARCEGHEVSIPIDTTVEELDLPSENIATLLCYIELHHKHYIKVLNNTYTKCTISSYGGPIKILEAAKSCPPLAMAYLLEGKKNNNITKNNVLEFNVIEVAAAMGWESGMTKYHLKNLEWITKDGTSKRSHLKVEFHTLGFKLKAPGDLSASELDNVLDDLHKIVHNQEKNMLHQLEEINKAFNQLCNYSWDKITFSEEGMEKNSNELKSIINNYFSRQNSLPENVVLQERPLDIERVTSDVRTLIATYKDCKFTGRSIARIFQGIQSPNFPAIVWGRCKFWRSHLHEDFYGIVKIATQQIIQMKI
ncbi:ATP-dependent DNA helicase Q4 [Maniola hyperantus]|uniref:ATP-dependent DNA helicase Q4 n=1 Tax=Aphantopus hyperantus TaxID=2795564 RepID=UPI0015682319|nr:ATP-dependent DNA helicase Q4 [Maniola hyperantus]